MEGVFGLRQNIPSTHSSVKYNDHLAAARYWSMNISSSFSWKTLLSSIFCQSDLHG